MASPLIERLGATGRTSYVATRPLAALLAVIVASPAVRLTTVALKLTVFEPVAKFTPAGTVTALVLLLFSSISSPTAPERVSSNA